MGMGCGLVLGGNNKRLLLWWRRLNIFITITFIDMSRCVTRTIVAVLPVIPLQKWMLVICVPKVEVIVAFAWLFRSGDVQLAANDI
jgi:hypothetical protein